MKNKSNSREAQDAAKKKGNQDNRESHPSKPVPITEKNPRDQPREDDRHERRHDTRK